MSPGVLDGGCDNRVERREVESCMEVKALQRRVGVPSKWLCVLEGRGLYEYCVWNVVSAFLCECCMVVGQVKREPATGE
jgi:hypothetical protein